MLHAARRASAIRTAGQAEGRGGEGGARKGRERYQGGGEGGRGAPPLVAGVGSGGASSARGRGCAGESEGACSISRQPFPRQRAAPLYEYSLLIYRPGALSSLHGQAFFQGSGRQSLESKEGGGRNGVGMGGGEGRGKKDAKGENKAARGSV